MQPIFTNVNTRSEGQRGSLAAGCGCCAPRLLHAASCCEAANEVIELAACSRRGAVQPRPAARLPLCPSLRSASYGILTHPVGSSSQDTNPNFESAFLISLACIRIPLSKHVMYIIKSIITSGFFISNLTSRISTPSSAYPRFAIRRATYLI